MTRPRAYQVNDPGTHYARYQLPATPTSSTMDLTGSDYASFLAASVSGGIAGTEESIPAKVLGTDQEPFHNILDGHQIGVVMTGVNGGAPVPVTFQTSDFVTIAGVQSLTAARAAARINAALATYGVTYAAASNVEGRLQLVSASGSGLNVGSGVSVVITEAGFTPGILQRLGFGVVSSVSSNDPGQQAAATAPVRGVITRSVDGRGGYFPLRYTNGEAVLTQTTQLMNWTDGAGVVRMWPNVVGGQTVYGRLTTIATPGVRLSFFANDYATASNISNGGDFASLSGTGHSFRIQVSGSDPADRTTITPFTVTVSFGGTYNSAADVVNAINAAWQSAVGSSAIAVSSVPEPYALESTDSLAVHVNGSTMVSVTFSTSTGSMTAQNVVDAINTVSPGLASVVSTGGRNYVKLTATTSLQFLGGRTAINKIGFPYAKVVPSTIASVYGASEMKFSVPFTDAASGGGSMTVNIYNLSGNPLDGHMGFPAPMTMTTTSREVPAQPTAWPDPTGGVGIAMLIPETLELGDVPEKEMTTLQQFLNQDTVQQTQSWAGSANANRPINYDRNGRIPANALAGQMLSSISAGSLVVGGDAASDQMPRINVPFKYSDSSLAWTLLSESLGTPATAPPATTQTTHAIRSYVASQAAGTTVLWNIQNAKWKSSSSKFGKDVSGREAVALTFSNSGSLSLIVKDATDNADWSTWPNPTIAVWKRNPTSVVLTLGSADVPYGTFQTPNAPIKFNDVHCYAADSGGVYLTDGSGGQFLRLSDQDATLTDADYSLCRAVNARTYVTVGNGTTTFGDFNGATALQDAIAFLVSGDVKAATIYVKPGTYTATSTIAVSAMDLAIIGMGRQVTGTFCNIEAPATGNTITFTRTVAGGRLRLENLNISASAGYYGVEMVAGAYLHAENCAITQLCLRAPAAWTNVADNLAAHIKKCGLINILSGKPVVSVMDASACPIPMLFEDCDLYDNYYNVQMFYIQAASGMGSVNRFAGVNFDRCRFQLSTAVASGNNLNTNTGLLDLNPNGNDVRAGTGLIVDGIVYNKCTVACWSPTGGMNVLLHLLPTANGTDADVSGAFMYIDHLQFRDCSFSHSARPATAFNAFTCAGARRVTIERCKYEIKSPSTSGIHGKQTADCQHMFTGAAVSDANWASLAIAADDIVIHDLECTGFLHKSTSGDILLRYNDAIDVDGIQCSQYSLTPNTGGVPNYRVATVYGENTSPFTGIGTVHTGMIAGIKLHGVQATNTGSWCLYAFILGALENTEITRAQMTGFRTSNGQTATQSCVCLIELAGLCDDSDNFKITNCLFTDMRGIDVYATYLWNGTISGNEIVDSNDVGINVSVTWVTGCLNILNNSIEGCYSVGIAVWYDNTDGPMRVSNNTCLYNDVAFNSNQISIRPNSGVDVEPVVVAYGNNCYSMDAGSAGYIRVSRRVDSSEAALPTPVSRNNGFGSGTYFGCETGNATTITFAYTDAALMLHNMAYLHSG